MALPMLYSRRKRIAQQQGADVYQYETMSIKLRRQVIFVFNEWNQIVYTYNNPYAIYSPVVEQMRKELGVFSLVDWSENTQNEFEKWFVSHNNLEDILDAIEVAVMMAIYHASRRHDGSTAKVQQGIDEINARALEDSFGFQIEDGQIIEIGTKFTHKEITVPAINLLSDAGYSEANTEFRQAYEEYKSGNYDDCIHDCCNAFESVLKIIINKKGWSFNNNDPAKKLLAVAFDNGLIPTYMQNEFAGLRTILESGVPTVRNKEGGHGTGINPRNIPKHIASFQLHQTAAAIVLLVEAAK